MMHILKSFFRPSSAIAATISARAVRMDRPRSGARNECTLWDCFPTHMDMFPVWTSTPTATISLEVRIRKYVSKLLQIDIFFEVLLEEVQRCLFQNIRNVRITYVSTRLRSTWFLKHSVTCRSGPQIMGEMFRKRRPLCACLGRAFWDLRAHTLWS